MPLLDVEGVSKRFGGVIANQLISIHVQHGEILGLIGPNGAGKSTLFDVITGFLKADSGKIRFNGHDIGHLRPDQINRMGIARTFQKMRPFGKMSVVENVMVAALPIVNGSLTKAREIAFRNIEFVGLSHKAHALGEELSTGQRKRLELARALSTRPKLMLLDEVTGGVDHKSIPSLLELIRNLRKGGVTLVIIEHNMRVITSLSDRIVALYLGRIICEGSPREIVRDQHLIECYLGERYAQGG
jgi:branched-chain amino acid transport system ATP-binding protein